MLDKAFAAEKVPPRTWKDEAMVNLVPVSTVRRQKSDQASVTLMKTGNSSNQVRSGGSRSLRKKALAIAITSVFAVAALQTNAVAGPREQAKRIHDRLVGTPPSNTTLDQMATMITNDPTNGPLQAAQFAIDPTRTEAGPFYTYTLKNFIAPATNRDQQVFVPLNDYTATVIGMVRDRVPFNTVLSDDILYIGDSSSGAPAYSPANNNHYQFLDDNNVDLRAHLTRTTQSSLTGIPAAATAGVITTRGGASAFFIAGTNRAMFRFTLLNHLCHDMEQVQDTSRPADRIRQDVSRSPGGDSRIFLNSCVGCHSGMDPMAQAFAYYNFDAASGVLQYTPGQVQPKYLINSDNFKPGYVTPDDHWDNRWRQGPNSILGINPADPAPPASGWSSSLPGSGAGAKSLGTELENSEAFAQCQVEKVFKQVCLRSPSDATDRSEIVRMVNVFKSNQYDLQRVFAEAAASSVCRGQ